VSLPVVEIYQVDAHAGATDAARIMIAARILFMFAPCYIPR
jgi:hypothetical protein